MKFPPTLFHNECKTEINMRLNIQIVVLILTFSVNSNFLHAQTTPDDEDLKVLSVYPNLLAIDETKYRFDDGVKSVDEQVVKEFDTNGNVIWTKVLNKEKEIILRFTYEYDENGNCIKSTKNNIKEKKIYSSQYDYDSHGRVISLIMRDGDGKEKRKEVTKYNANGDVIEHVSSSGRFGDKVVFEYDSLNSKIAEYHFNNDGSISDEHKIEVSYSITGSVASTSILTDGVLQSKAVFNSEGLIVESISYSPDGAISYRETFTYDSKGRLIKNLEFTEDGLSSSEELSYDDFGNLIMRINRYYDGSNVVDETKSTMIIEYTNGRTWKKITTSVNGELFRIQERLIHSR